VCLQKEPRRFSRKKVGCTKGSVEDYLKALYANADGETKKENKSMKMKKSELLVLIKEEIMAEAEMFKMSDEDLRDFSVPDPQEYKQADEIFNMVMEDLEKEVEYDLLDIIKEIIMERPGQKPQDMANEAFGKLMDRLRAQERPHAPLQEGMDAESAKILADAVQKMAPLIGAMSLPVLIGLIYEQLKNMGAK
jgi:hypothetical protein